MAALKDPKTVQVLAFALVVAVIPKSHAGIPSVHGHHRPIVVHPVHANTGVVGHHGSYGSHSIGVVPHHAAAHSHHGSAPSASVIGIHPVHGHHGAVSHHVVSHLAGAVHHAPVHHGPVHHYGGAHAHVPVHHAAAAPHHGHTVTVNHHGRATYPSGVVPHHHSSAVILPVHHGPVHHTAVHHAPVHHGVHAGVHHGVGYHG